MKGASAQTRSFSSLLETENDFEEDDQKPGIVAQIKNQWSMLSKKKKIAVVVGVLGALAVVAGIVGVVVGLVVKKPSSEEAVMVVSPNITTEATPPSEQPVVIVPVPDTAGCVNSTPPYSETCLREWWYISGCRSAYVSNRTDLENNFLQNATVDEIIAKFESIYNRAVIGEGAFEQRCEPIPSVLKEAIACRRALEYICSECREDSLNPFSLSGRRGVRAHEDHGFDAPYSSCLMYCWANNMTDIRPYCPLNPVLEQAIACHSVLATTCKQCIRWTPTLLRLDVACLYECGQTNNATVVETCPVAPSIIQVTACKHAVTEVCRQCLSNDTATLISFNDSICIAHCWQDNAKILEKTCPVPRPVQEALDCQYIVNTECRHCVGENYYQSDLPCISNCLAELPATLFRPGMRCEIDEPMQMHLNCSQKVYDLCGNCLKTSSTTGEHGAVQHMSSFDPECLPKCWDANPTLNISCPAGIEEFYTQDALFLVTGIFGAATTPAAVFSFISSLFPGITHGIALGVPLDGAHDNELYDKLYPQMTLSIVIGLLFPSEGLEEFIWRYFPPVGLAPQGNTTESEAYVAELNAVFAGKTDIKPSDTMADFLVNLNDMFAPLSAGRATINVVLPDNETVLAWTDLPMFFKVILWFSLPRSAAEVKGVREQSDGVEQV